MQDKMFIYINRWKKASFIQ